MNKQPNKFFIIISIIGLVILGCMEITIYLEKIRGNQSAEILTEYVVNERMTIAMMLITIVILMIVFTAYLIFSVIKYKKKLWIIPIIIVVAFPFVIGIKQASTAYQEWQDTEQKYESYMEEVNKELQEE